MQQRPEFCFIELNMINPSLTHQPPSEVSEQEFGLEPQPCDGSQTNCFIFPYLVAVVVVVRFRVVDVSVRGAAGDLKLYVGYYWRGEI